nr:unnamed protein product [Callosobruchus analis]
MWQFENCLGAMDGKHILIKKPSNSGSYYFNYKGTFSVVLFAIVNANYEFLYVHTGTNGRVSDGGIWNNTGICKTLLNTSDQFPYVFIGDEAFPLMENLMKPRARRVVENVFGILASRFRIFLQPIAIDIESIDAVVLACCALHNFLRKRSKKNYITESSVDYEDIVNGTVIPGEWRQNGNLLGLDRKNTTKNASNSAKEIRNKYKNYYNSFGKTSFQEKMIA